MHTNQRNLTTFRKVFARALLLALVFTFAAPAGLAAPQAASGGISSLGVVQQWSLSAPDPSALDEFGYAVALEGNTAVIGARNADPNQGNGPIDDAGAVFVYVHSGKTWVLEAELSAKNAAPGDTFGVSVALSGNTLLVGATGVDLEDPEQEDEVAKDAGAAYIFTRASGEWVQQAKLTASNRAEDDSFGTAVALYQNTAVIASQNKTFNTGAAYVFSRDADNKWHQRKQLCAGSSGTLCDFSVAPGENFGAALAVYGNHIAVGATQSGPGITPGEGVVYLFQRVGGDWQPEAVLEAEEGREGDGFGNALGLYRSTLVVGASHADPDLGGGRVTSAGAAYVFSDTGDEWEEVAYLTAANSLAFDQFGEAVDIDGDTLVVGADGATQMGNPSAGAVYVFKKTGGGWSLQTRAVTNPAGEDDLFGKSVALSRDWFVAGASGRDPESRTRAGEAFLNLLGAVQLPSTGFAPGVQTRLPVQPEALAYRPLSAGGEMLLEIPALQEKLSVVGVPKSGDGWDVRWLGGQAGYLEGTAFPTWQGNSALAGHATLADGQPGPFAELEQLSWGDRVILEAWGQQYIYEVRQNSLVAPGDVRALRHEQLAWLTLVTCQGFDELTQAFRWRRIVRAVLVEVQD